MPAHRLFDLPLTVAQVAQRERKLYPERVHAREKRYRERHPEQNSMTNHPFKREYSSWVAMRQRCRNPKATRFERYGGRGITICERWEIFENFLADTGPRPKGTTLDRFPNNDGNYKPGNCRWATVQQQNSNK